VQKELHVMLLNRTGAWRFISIH